MDEIYNFRGHQYDNNRLINIHGVFQILPKEYEFRRSITGELFLEDSEFRISGSLVQLSLILNPRLNFLATTENNRYIHYRLEPVEFKNDVIKYKGSHELLERPTITFERYLSKDVELEIILK